MEPNLFTRKDLRQLMEVTGYPMASIEKTLRLLSLLKAVNEDPFLGENLVLKGGTAINVILYDEVPRLSVDLDFDLALNTPKEEMLLVKDAISERIRYVAETAGYVLNDPRPNYAVHQMELFYNGITGNRDKIKLDINCLSRCHVFEPVVKSVSNNLLPNEGSCCVRILSEYELFGAKLKALLERNTPRDIFDAYILEQKGLYQDKESISRIRKCLVYYLSLTRGVNIKEALDCILNRPAADFKKQLYPMLKSGYGYVDHVRMASDAVKCISRYLSFTQNELDYLEAAKAGTYRPDLLFDAPFAEKLADSPAAKFFITGKIR